MSSTHYDSIFACEDWHTGENPSQIGEVLGAGVICVTGKRMQILCCAFDNGRKDADVSEPDIQAQSLRITKCAVQDFSDRTNALR